MLCPPGHDAWIVGEETCVVIDWQGLDDYGVAMASSDPCAAWNRTARAALGNNGSGSRDMLQW